MNPQSKIALGDVVSNILAYLPSLLAGLVVLLLGLLVAWITARVVVRVLIWMRLDRVVQRLRWGTSLAKGDVRHTLYALVGTGVGGLVFLIFLANALVLWRLTVLSSLLEGLVGLVPNLIVAAIILVVGTTVASMVGRSVRRALYEEEVERAALISRVIRAAIIVFASPMALLHLRVAPTLVTQAFIITFGALALSFVLAFGLGSRKAVEAMWEGVFKERKKPASGKPTHPKSA